VREHIDDTDIGAAMKPPFLTSIGDLLGRRAGAGPRPLGWGAPGLRRVHEPRGITDGKLVKGANIVGAAMVVEEIASDASRSRSPSGIQLAVSGRSLPSVL